jgi:F0F1-type ATP synthase assembly protein I
MAVDNNDDKKSASYTVARYSQVAFIVPGGVVAGLLIGALIDKWLHTHWVYIAGVIFGAIVGFIQLVRTVTSASDKN